MKENLNLLQLILIIEVADEYSDVSVSYILNELQEDFNKERILNINPNLILYNDSPCNIFELREYFCPVGFKCLTIKSLSV